MISTPFFNLCLLLFVFNSCTGQVKEKYTQGIFFYNVENLYDIIDDEKIDDQEFLPTAEKAWDADKYATKIDHIGAVIEATSNQLPTIIGLVEIENSAVLKDLITSDKLKAGKYNIVHFDSPDERGVDVAFLYRKEFFTPKNTLAIPVHLTGEKIDFTRDILLVSGEFKMGKKIETVHFFVNHWPSRSEGEEISAPKRAMAAQVLKMQIDSLNVKYNNPNIIIMGDFNDTPFDHSITKILGALPDDSQCKENCLINLMAKKQTQNEGSYNFKGNWQALDQFIVSQNLLNSTNLDIVITSPQFVKKDFMLYKNEKQGYLPNRTYSGSKYHGGYSDHLPIYIEISLY